MSVLSVLPLLHPDLGGWLQVGEGSGGGVTVLELVTGMCFPTSPSYNIPADLPSGSPSPVQLHVLGFAQPKLLRDLDIWTTFEGPKLCRDQGMPLK